MQQLSVVAAGGLLIAVMAVGGVIGHTSDAAQAPRGVSPSNRSGAHRASHSPNDARRGQDPFPTIRQMSYPSAAAAGRAIAAIMKEHTHMGFAPHNGLPSVHLGFGVSATEGHAQDRRGLQWHHEQWTVETLWFAGNRGGRKLARSIVDDLHRYMVPLPNDRGIIIVQSTAPHAKRINPSTTIAWQEGNDLYELQQAGSPGSAVRAVSGGTQGTAETPAKVEVNATPNPAQVHQEVTVHVRLLTANGSGAGNQRFTVTVPGNIFFGTVYTNAQGNFTVHATWSNPGTYVVSAGDGKVDWHTSVVVK